MELNQDNLEIYRNDSEAARDMAASGLPNPLPADVPVAELAAWTLVGNVL